MFEALLSQNMFWFGILVLIYAIGEFVSTITKAWIPSVFVIAALFIIGYNTFFPQDIVTKGGFGVPLGGMVSMMLCLTHMGTAISLKELAKQWKVIVICLAGLAGMILFVFFIGGLFVDKSYIISGLPPLTGGIVAATMMQAAAAEKGLELAALLAICMYVMQGFAGYPLTAILLKKEGSRLIADYRKNGGKAVAKVGKIDETNGKIVAEEAPRKKLLKPLPDKFNTTATSLFKMAVCAWIAFCIQYLTRNWGANGSLKLNQAVVALVIGIILTEIGFLDVNILKKNGCFNFLMLALMMFIFDGLKTATFAQLATIVGPLVIIIVTGVIGMFIFAGVVSKILKVSVPMGISTALTALYGFPPNYVITDEATSALAENKEEKEYLMDEMLPMMIVGGFVTVTITSVVVAGIFANML